MLETLETLESLEDSCIHDQHKDFKTVCAIASEALRVLNICELDLYDKVFHGSVHDCSIAYIAEDVPSIREELGTIQNLITLYEELRLLKLEGKVYDILDNFFNGNLDRTL